MGTEKGAETLRDVRLPAGWEGLSFKTLAGSRLIVAEVPKACFSSAAFGAGAKPQVEGVQEGDEIVTLNGETIDSAVERITAAGDAWNACSSASPPHAAGSKTKFDSPPCAACDFVRRRKGLGLDVALQMWLRAVKREIKFTLGVRTGSAELLAEAAAAPSASATESQPAAQNAKGSGEPSAVVDLGPSGRSSQSLDLGKSLDDLTWEARGKKRSAQDWQEDGSWDDGSWEEGWEDGWNKWEAEPAELDKKKSKGKGKKGKKPKPSGPHLPRTRVSLSPITGEVVEWKGKYGWVKPSEPIDHLLASKHQGKIYVSVIDLGGVKELSPGATLQFQVFSDSSGLGAEECELRFS